MSKLLKNILFILIGFGLFGVFIYYSNFHSLKKLTSIQLLPTFGAFFASLGITICIALRWGTLANAITRTKSITWFEYYHYFIINRAIGFILPKDLTDVGGRTYMLKKRHKKSLSDAGSSVLLDRIFDLVFMATFLLAVLPYWVELVNETFSFILMGLFPIITGVVITVASPLFFKVTGGFFTFILMPFRYVPFIKKKIPKKIAITPIEKKELIKVYFYSLFKFGFTVFRLVLFVFALGLDISPEIIILGTPLGQLSYLFAFTPGGIGIFEAGWLGILKLSGITTSIAMDYVVGQRILTIVLISLLALISQMVFTLKTH